jgi:hypothetical protein
MQLVPLHVVISAGVAANCVFALAILLTQVNTVAGADCLPTVYPVHTLMQLTHGLTAPGFNP